MAAERRARETLLRDLRSLHPPYRVTVNGLTAAEPAAIVEALKTVAPVKVYVHRKSLDPIELVIRDEARTIRLAVAQDSRLWQQFWVSVPNDSLFRPYGQDAGRVTDWRLAGLLSSSGKN